MLKFIGAVTCVGFGALILIVLFAVAGSHGNSSTPSGDAASASLGPAVRVSAMKLFFDYQANEVQADKAYRDQHLIVTGVVTGIKKDVVDDVYLTLLTGNEFMPVNAHLRESEVDAAAGLHIMQPVQVDCVGRGMVIGSPQLRNCTIVQGEEPADAPVVSNEPAVGSQPPSSDVSSEPSPSEPATDEGSGVARDSAGTDASSGDVHEEQKPPTQLPAQEEQTPQQPPAQIERH